MNICIVYGSTKLIPVYSGTLKKCVHWGFATENMEFKILAGLVYQEVPFWNERGY
jgi:hypothetical protein